jgi:hypothetical protein
MAMSIENEFKFIGWNTEGNSDKIWGYFLRPTTIDPRVNYWEMPSKEVGWNCCIFWGRRGKAMQFKGDITGYELNKLVNSKLKKGYLKIDQNKLLNIWPTFIAEAEAKLMWDVLAGKVK